VTVTEVDLPRKRIALSLRSNPVLGPKTQGGTGGPRTSPGGPGSIRSAAPARRPAAPPQSLNGDWFTAALNKKK